MQRSDRLRGRPQLTVKASGALLALALTLASCTSRSPGVHPPGDTAPPPATVWSAPARTAPPTLVLSGYSGPALYEAFAAGLATQGYWVALFDGRAVSSEAALRRAIEWARQAPGTQPGKVAVIGFSWGGAATLAHAVALEDSVSVAIVYYPYTAWITDPGWVAERLRVPTLALAGVQDRYRDCCPIEIIRAIDAAARRRQAPWGGAEVVEDQHINKLRRVRHQVSRPTAESAQMASNSAFE